MPHQGSRKSVTEPGAAPGPNDSWACVPFTTRQHPTLSQTARGDF